MFVKSMGAGVEAWKFVTVALAFGMLLAWSVNRECLLMAAIGGVLTACYPVPPVRLKRWGITASLIIAIRRGLLLPVAGWSTAKRIADAKPWLLGAPLGIFMFGAIVTKDFSDIAGDSSGG